MKKRYISTFSVSTICLLYIFANISGALPPSEINVLTSFGLRSLFKDNAKTTKVEWTRPDRTSFFCDLVNNKFGHYCGIDIKVDDNHKPGEDLSKYTHLHLRFSLKGSGDHIRINFRNAFDDSSLDPDGKQMDKVKLMKEGVNDYFLPLDKFTIPQYWINRNPQLYKTHNTNERDKITNLGFFYEGANAAGPQIFTIEKYLFVNRPLKLLNALVYSLLLLMLLTTAVMYLLEYFHRRRTPISSSFHSESDIRSDWEELLNNEISELNAYDVTSGFLSRESTIALLDRHTDINPDTNMQILVVSLDDYDQVASKFGSQAASEYRLTAAITVKSCLRKRGVACSWNESQFLIILADSMAAFAKKIVDGISNEAAVEKFSNQKIPLKLSVYMATASGREDIETLLENQKQNPEQVVDQ